MVPLSEIVIAVYGWRKLCTLTSQLNNGSAQHRKREAVKGKNGILRSSSTPALIIKVMRKEKIRRGKKAAAVSL
jgi:hypothetical protein